MPSMYFWCICNGKSAKNTSVPTSRVKFRGPLNGFLRDLILWSCTAVFLAPYSLATKGQM